MLKIRYSSRFKKDFKTIVKRGYNVKLLEFVLAKNKQSYRRMETVQVS